MRGAEDLLADFEAQGSHTGMALTSVAAPSRPAPLVIRLFQADHNHTYNCKVHCNGELDDECNFVPWKKLRESLAQDTKSTRCEWGRKEHVGVREGCRSREVG